MSDGLDRLAGLPGRAALEMWGDMPREFRKPIETAMMGRQNGREELSRLLHDRHPHAGPRGAWRSAVKEPVSVSKRGRARVEVGAAQPRRRPLHQGKGRGEPPLLRSRSRSALRRLPHGPHDRFRMIGLLQGQTARDRAGRDRRKTGRVDHRQVGIVLATALGNLPPVDSARQLDVGDEHIRDALLALIKASSPSLAAITWKPSSCNASTTNSRMSGSSPTKSICTAAPHTLISSRNLERSNAGAVP
jgi:hypothetical protein